MLPFKQLHFTWADEEGSTILFNGIFANQILLFPYPHIG